MAKAGGKKIPARRCVGCGEMKPKKEMLRVIRDTDGRIRLDLGGRQNGRGAYLCRSADCLRRAVKNKGLERSLKSAVDETVLEQIEKELSDAG